MRETDLYPAIKAFLEQQGYEVQAEVKDCDVVARDPNSGQLIIVELKTGPNLSLLVQATERQAISETVYVAFPKKRYGRRRWTGIQRVIKRLGLGLLLVSQGKAGDLVTEYFAPVTMRKTVARKQNAVIREMDGRTASYNTGGASGDKLMTAYRQNAVLVACFLKRLGSASGAELRRLGAPDNARDIMADNYYGWFERVSRGIYQLTSEGQEEPAGFDMLWQQAERLVSADSPRD